MLLHKRSRGLSLVATEAGSSVPVGLTDRQLLRALGPLCGGFGKVRKCGNRSARTAAWLTFSAFEPSRKRLPRLPPIPSSAITAREFLRALAVERRSPGLCHLQTIHMNRPRRSKRSGSAPVGWWSILKVIVFEP
jgi:hypothetical protein